MVFVAILIGCIIGAIIGANGPVISYEYSGYLAIAIIAALDSVFGGITSVLNGKFDLKIFISGFFGNAILSIMLTWLGVKLNVDIYLAAIVVFVGRMFTNLAIIRRYYVDIMMKKVEEKRKKWLTNRGTNDIIAERFAGDRGERKSLEKSFEKNEKSS